MPNNIINTIKIRNPVTGAMDQYDLGAKTNIFNGTTTDYESLSSDQAKTYSHIAVGETTSTQGELLAIDKNDSGAPTGTYTKVANNLDLKYIKNGEGHPYDLDEPHSIIEGCTEEGDYTPNIAPGLFSHAEGQGTTADGDEAHAEGNNTYAHGKDSHAEGYETTAYGNRSHAEGFKTSANGVSGSHAEGYKTTAYGYASHAEGGDTIAASNLSHAEGSNTIAYGDNSHAEGYGTTAYGGASHAEGSSTSARGGVSHSEGYQTTAYEYSSHAEGYRTYASGNASHAEGDYTSAVGNYSHAEGDSTCAAGYCQTVIGMFNRPVGSPRNKTDTDLAFIIGNGTYGNNSNAFAVQWNGNLVLADGTVLPVAKLKKILDL